MILSGLKMFGEMRPCSSLFNNSTLLCHIISVRVLAKEFLMNWAFVKERVARSSGNFWKSVLAKMENIKRPKSQFDSASE